MPTQIGALERTESPGQASRNIQIDLDIKSFFDTIDHELLMKAVKKYVKEKWVLMYIERWLQSGILRENGRIEITEEGTLQGSVISPLLANVFMHFVFDNGSPLHHMSGIFLFLPEIKVKIEG